MSDPLHVITAQALALDPADRLRLATVLIGSVDGPVDPDWENAWLAELEARRRRGTADAVPWSEVRAQVLRRLAGR